MSLQVWLPLTKDLRQQGLSNVIATASSGATYSSTGGKLGGCYTIVPTHGITLPASAMTSFTTGCSVAFWIKINSWKSSYDTFFQAGLNSTPWAHYRFGILRYGSGSTLCFTITNSSGSSSSASYVTSSLDTGVWYHLTFTYTAGKVSCYRNGILDKEYTTTIVPDFAGITNISIGRGTNGTSYPTDCNLNDFRIYNHCLSPMEVKELAKGLVLHYPLNRQGWGQENLLLNSNDLTLWPIESSGKIELQEDGYFKVSSKASNTTRYGIYYDFTFPEPNTYTFSVDVRDDWLIGVAPASTFTWTTANLSGTQGKKRISYTCTSTEEKNKCRIYIAGTGTGGRVTYLKQPKLEKGSIATPWCPNTADANNMGLNGTTEYDCSGFCNNGIWHGIHTNTSDTPRYEVSTTATGSVTTYLEGVPLPAEAKTVSLWIKNTSKSSNGAIFNDKTSGLQIGLLNSLLYMNCLANTAGFTTTHWKNGEWNHVVAINNNGTRSMYVNGQAEVQSGANNYYIHNADNFWLWNRSYNNNYPFTGSLSDLRIYATALSASDVKALYDINKL